MKIVYIKLHDQNLVVRTVLQFYIEMSRVEGRCTVTDRYSVQGNLPYGSLR